MKKLMLSAAVAVACVVPQAYAQQKPMPAKKNFEGFSIGLSANSNNAKTDFTSRSPSDTSTTAGVQATYGWGFSNDFVLGLSLGYDTGNVKGGTQSGIETVYKGQSFLTVDPGFRLNPNALLYLKLGYATVQGSSSGSATASDTYTGTAVGVGFRYMFNPNWSFDVEGLQYTYLAKQNTALGGDVKPSSTAVTVGVSYHF